MFSNVCPPPSKYLTLLYIPETCDSLVICQKYDRNTLITNKDHVMKWIIRGHVREVCNIIVKNFLGMFFDKLGTCLEYVMNSLKVQSIILKGLSIKLSVVVTLCPM